MVVEIDGSILEGGGQILRISVALSVLLRIPIKIQKIRANRAKGGLAPQHLTGLKLARDLCKGYLENAELRSTEISFTPGIIESGNFTADTQTGGSVSLMLQTALPCILFGSNVSYLTLKGGTNVEWAPQIDYVINVFQPVIQKFGINFDCEIIKRGFFQGNGSIKVTADVIKKLQPIELMEFGELESIKGEAYVSGVLPLKVASEMAQAAERFLKNSLKTNISITFRKLNSSEAFGNGSGINLFATTSTKCYLGSSQLGKKGFNPMDIGLKAAENLIKYIKEKICVDPNMQDQVIIYMALADGISRIKVGSITSHTLTAIHMCKLLTPAKFSIENLNDNINIIECKGIGHENKLV